MPVFFKHLLSASFSIPDYIGANYQSYLTPKHDKILTDYLAGRVLLNYTVDINLLHYKYFSM